MNFLDKIGNFVYKKVSKTMGFDPETLLKNELIDASLGEKVRIRYKGCGIVVDSRNPMERLLRIEGNPLEKVPVEVLGVLVDNKEEIKEKIMEEAMNKLSIKARIESQRDELYMKYLRGK